MKAYRIFVKNKFSGELEPISVYSHKPISDAEIKMIRNMTYEEASAYCRRRYNASIWRGHYDREE